jgi:hypothetical protein
MQKTFFLFLFLFVPMLSLAQSFEHNFTAVDVFEPAPNTRLPLNIPMSVVIEFKNTGTHDETHVILYSRITNDSNSLDYNDTIIIDSLWPAGKSIKITFKDCTPKTFLGYHIYGIVKLDSDQYNYDDTVVIFQCVGYYHDLKGISVIRPGKDTIISEKDNFKIEGAVSIGLSCTAITNAPVRVQIRKCEPLSFGARKIMFQSDTTIPLVPSDLTPVKISFPTMQGIYDIKKLPIGCYDLAVLGNKPDDADRTNDTAFSKFFIGDGHFIVVDSILSPKSHRHFDYNSLVPLTIRFQNQGADIENGAKVSADVRRNIDESLVFQDSSIQNNWAKGDLRTIEFRPFFSSRGGIYNVNGWAAKSAESSDLISTFTIGDPCDVAVISIVAPVNDDKIRQGIAENPVALFDCRGYGPVNNIPIEMQIRRCLDGQLVFRSDTIIPELTEIDTAEQFLLPYESSGGRFVDLPPACYHLCVISKLDCDSDHSNDTACTDFEIISSASVDAKDSKEFSLSQNSPNPFSSATSITYTLPDNGEIILRIFDVTGRVIENQNGFEEAGEHKRSFNLENLPNGIYTYELVFTRQTEGPRRISRKMVVLK